MGIVIDRRNFREPCSSSRLILMVLPDKDIISHAVSVNRPIAEKLIRLKPQLRTIHLEKCFYDVISGLPDGTIIKDIDVMFNPEYKVAVLKILISANKQKPINVIWPGRYADGKLYYSEETLPDYKVFEISDYDIYCVV